MTRTSSVFSLLLGGFSAGILISACTTTLSDHCAQKDGDGSCGAGEFCSECVEANNGCVDAMPSEDCWKPGDETGSGEETGTASGDGDGDETMSGSADSSDDSGSAEGPGCQDDDDCSGETPFCDEGTCAGCGEADADFCDNNGGGLPACGESGACVVCSGDDVGLCGGETPICEVEMCVGCTEHDQCPDSACDLAAGGCMPMDRVWWVDNSVVGPGTGTQPDPFKTIALGMMEIGPGEAGTIMLVEGSQPYFEQILVNGDRKVAVLAQGSPEIFGPDAQEAVEVTTQGTAYLSGVTLRLVETNSARCDTATLWFDDAEIADGISRGIDASGCSVTVRRAELIGNGLSAIRALGASTVRVENTIVAENGNNGATFGIEVSGSDLSMSYVTSVENEANVAGASLNCLGGTATIRNSILLAGGGSSPDPISCPGGVFDYNATDDAEIGVGTNVQSPGFQPSWFVGGDNYHLSGNPEDTPFIDVALWEAGDPVTDIDGDPRPVDGSMSYCGADEPG